MTCECVPREREKELSFDQRMGANGLLTTPSPVIRSSDVRVDCVVVQTCFHCLLDDRSIGFQGTAF